MEISNLCIGVSKTLKEVTHHTNADESDELETAKLNVLKDGQKNLKKRVTQLPFLHNERI